MCPPDLRSDASPCPPQVFYHLGELNDALNYALCAGSLFDVSETTDFVQTLLGTRANPQNDSMEAVDGVLQWAHETYPCSE